MSERILTVEERTAYCAALADDWSGDADADGKEADEFTWSEVWSVFTEGGHVLLLCLPLFFSGVTVSISPYSGFQSAHDLANPVVRSSEFHSYYRRRTRVQRHKDTAFDRKSIFENLQ